MIDPRYAPRTVPTQPTGTEQAPVVAPTLELPPKKTFAEKMDEFMSGPSAAAPDRDPTKETATKRKAETVPVPTIDASAFYNMRSANLANQ